MKAYFALAIALALSPAIASASEVERDKHALLEFQKTHACPANGWTEPHLVYTQKINPKTNKRIKHLVRCPGYVIDHVKPLDCGGADAPPNMQWQTVAAGHAKDRWERNGPECKHRTHGALPEGSGS